ncbi:MAG: hypothetical protein ABIH89_10090 [Elusimicrobiota bacterium]
MLCKCTGSQICLFCRLLTLFVLGSVCAGVGYYIGARKYRKGKPGNSPNMSLSADSDETSADKPVNDKEPPAGKHDI